MPLFSKKLPKIRLFTLNNLKDFRVKIVLGGKEEENKGKRNVDKVKFPYSLQPIDKITDTSRV